MVGMPPIVQKEIEPSGIIWGSMATTNTVHSRASAYYCAATESHLSRDHGGG
jgi:hypothetical protein